jgi:hypothetical protein
LVCCSGGKAQSDPLGKDSLSTFQMASLGSFDMQPRSPADTSSDEPFGLGAFALNKGGLVRKWSAVKRGLAMERRVLARCRENAETCPAAAKRFLAVVDKALTREDGLRIAEINRTINLNIRPVAT